jgi:hypothetical protein
MTIAEDILLVGCWWRGHDRVVSTSPSAFATVARCPDDAQMALVSGSMEAAVAARRSAGNVPYVARVRGEAAGFAWVARTMAHIPPLGLSFELPRSDRMIQDLHVLEAGVGLGICPLLVQTVIAREKAERFWVVVRPEHAAEIEDAGFTIAARLFRAEGTATMECGPSAGRARALAGLLGLAPARARSASAAA